MDRIGFMDIIYKAEKNGYKEHLGMLPILPINEKAADILVSKLLWVRRYEIIFSHKFAKAFWGVGDKCPHCKGESKNWIEGYCPVCFCSPNFNKKWQAHLSKMVLEKDPLKYLEKFL